MGTVFVALVLAFGVVLLVSVSLSEVAARTILSTALLFTVLFTDVPVAKALSLEPPDNVPTGRKEHDRSTG